MKDCIDELKEKINAMKCVVAVTHVCDHCGSPLGKVIYANPNERYVCCSRDCFNACVDGETFVATEENTIIQVGMSVAAAKRLNSVLQDIVISGRTVRHGTHDVSDVSLSVMLALREYEKVTK